MNLRFFCFVCASVCEAIIEPDSWYQLERTPLHDIRILAVMFKKIFGAFLKLKQTNKKNFFFATSNKEILARNYRNK